VQVPCTVFWVCRCLHNVALFLELRSGCVWTFSLQRPAAEGSVVGSQKSGALSTRCHGKV
jgi:hypothetical protein